MLKIKLNTLMYGMVVFAIMGGCSTAPKVQEFSDSANSAEEVQRLAADMETARERQVDVLSPNAYREADKALKSARSDQSNGEDTKDILHEVAIGRAQLKRANQFAELSRTNLRGAVEARKAAIQAGAPRYFAAEFNEADDHLRAVTSEIEDNDLEGVAQNRGKLQAEYMDVELKAIKQSNLGVAHATIALALKEGAQQNAQQTLAIAERKVRDTDAFIVANRHETAAIKRRAEDATSEADHLLKITRASKAGNNLTSEQAALRYEIEQNKTQAGQEQLTAERQTAKGLAVKSAGMKSDIAFNRSFDAARSEFTPEEAEVYRQGNQLVIRLRALKFPVNQSVLQGSNFPLLAKVTRVVKSFDNPTVVIEGHTDSDGGRALNKRLSTERADAVAAYLTSSGAIDSAHITTVGYGFERPLASNKTFEGKAQNRRVDIVISPGVMAE